MDTSLTLNWKDSDYYLRHPASQHARDACVARVDWDALCTYASSINQGKPCSLLPDSTMGGVHLIRLVNFEDTQWIARIQLEPATPATASGLRAEIDAMELVRARTTIPVPQVFGYKVDDTNPVRAAFTLMGFLPGSSAMDADGGYDVHHGSILPERRDTFYREVAGIQVQLASIRVPKIGTVVRREDNSFEVGPLPGIGGPFATATDFFIAWAKKAKFPASEKSIRKRVPDDLAADILNSVNNFPSRLQSIARKIATNDKDPFPLYHRDLYHSNMIVDERFRIIGTSDWEGASTVPWELFEPPLFIVVGPRALDYADEDAEDRQPEDTERIGLLEESARYVRYVQEREIMLKKDKQLSTVLLDPSAQGIARAVKVYPEGRLGFHCNVLKPFELLSTE
ncbi:phosphotransferase family protein [Aspergillus homomorphus CBS 101889]|uniref:Aminoglycoside phosphotransferase domain-containing protein n=1 Tax=Aspergillus homomorphus (strain CBS 101889) TaxID=1450537 RepID=A0A395IAW1_ASPHC|nr:hypothetical protein BO97DRAFT_455709 [Aspergillus homomorphus CBS 101889]RAL16218.1 hypothetical protein BO97DRAFT_455709 [Aspergillus homomorphus CBS 101889]